MANYGGFNFTGFSGVNLKNTAAIRFANTSGTSIDVAGTIAIPNDDEGSRAWRLPAKSGSLPIMGTFAVQFPAATAAAFSTIVTVSGIRVEDALVVQLNGRNVSGATYGFASSTGYIIVQAIPGNGSVTLQMQNLGNATAYIDLTASYLAMR